ncbi:MAG: hypothetical protein JXR48_12985 [Candidatus Delongbacteria bacterium]|nr:hypothetical protein [Candidatus Delongbacteria bacterium]
MKRFDLCFGNSDIIYAIAKKKGVLGEIVFLKPELTTIPSYIAFSKKADCDSLASEFAREMKVFKASRGYFELLKKYDIQEFR